MQNTEKILEELFKLDLPMEAIPLIRMVQNGYGGMLTEIKQEIIQKIEAESCFDDEVLLRAGKIKEIILKSGENLR